MRVHFFSKGDATVPSSRYRCFYFAEELERQGLLTRIVTPPPRRFGLRIPRGGVTELWRLHRELLRVERGDVMYLQRPTHNTLFIALAVLHQRLRRRRMIFDFCDPLWVHSPRKTELLARSADAVVVSCEDLAAWARRRNRRVHVIPNSVAPERVACEPAPGSGRARPLVGWVGGAKLHADNLRLLLPVCAALAGRVALRLIGVQGAADLLAEFRAVPGLELETVDWLDADAVAAELAALDVAVLPLLDIPWNGKLVTKLLEYMTAGLPVLASPVGDNRFAIRDGENGLLASNTQEWTAKLARLLDQPELRRRLAAAGLATVRERFWLPANGGRLADVVRSLA
ncbi:MAG: glycosyltransferase [Thermoanaerobaculia bacterium]